MLWIIWQIVWAVCTKTGICSLSFVNSGVERGVRVSLLGPRTGFRRRLTERQEPANRQRQVQSQARLGAIEVDPGDFIDAIHSIEQGITMHNQ